jgi:hypothetical protein
MHAWRAAALFALSLSACPEQLPPAQRGVPPDRLPPAEPIPAAPRERRGSPAVTPSPPAAPAGAAPVEPRPPAE